jgi:glycosyltransferase involved in cell wall biosynthesis
MARPVLHQVVVSATVGDAITDCAFLLRRWLRQMGFTSEIFAESVHSALAREARPLAAYRPRRAGQWLIYHHSIGSSVAEWSLHLPQRLIVIYHNITPSEFFVSVNPALAQQVEMGRDQLVALRPRTVLALAVSSYNERDLRAAGFVHTDVLPITLDESRYDMPSSPELLMRFDEKGPLLLFVGRLAPNKRQEDLIKLFYFYRRIEPSARLVLVGNEWLLAYERSLRQFARVLGVEDGVLFTGRVSQQDMVTFYRLADLYVSMSEHEGFGKPLIESMYFEVPVLAYAAGAVPDTLGGAGMLFHHKNYELLAEVVDILIRDEALRQRMIARQRDRVQSFLEPRVMQKWEGFVRQLGLT